eukprot:EG_transcript_47271
MADADAKSGSDPWGDGYGSPGMNDPGPGHKYNFTAKTGVKSVRKACEMLNEGYDITEWPFTLAYVYSESQQEWFAVFRKDFDRKDVPDADWIEPNEPWP